MASCIRQVSDSGYIICGYTASNNGDVSGNHGNTGSMDVWVVKIDKTGEIQWQRCYGGTQDDLGYDIIPTCDGGYILAACTNSDDGDVSGNNGDVTFSLTSSDMWVVKIDSTGAIQWQKCIGGSRNDCALSIIQDNDGTYTVAGLITVSDYDSYICNLDSSGNIRWQKVLGGSMQDEITSIIQTSDGGFIVNGFTSSHDGDVVGNHDTLGGWDYWVVKLDTARNIQWQRCFGGTSDDFGYTIEKTQDRGFIVSGFALSFDGDVLFNHSHSIRSDYWIIKLDSTGSSQWQKSLGGTNSDGACNDFDDVAAFQTSDLGYIVAGSSNSNDGDVTGNHGGIDFWVVKLGASTLSAVSQVDLPSVSVYPNPSTGKFIINTEPSIKSVIIYNMLGEKVQELKSFNQSSIQCQIDEDGVYMVRFVGTNGFVTKKLVINRRW